MAKVVNLNRYRKKSARADRQKTAAANRVKHGRAKAEKRNERLERERARTEIEAKRLDHGADEPDGA
jgi:hypothetical protein